MGVKRTSRIGTSKGGSKNRNKIPKTSKIKNRKIEKQAKRKARRWRSKILKSGDAKKSCKPAKKLSENVKAGDHSCGFVECM